MAVVRHLLLICIATALCLGCREAPPPAPLAGSNLVIVLADALRADRLGCYGYERPTSPFLDTLCRRSVVFDAATSASSHTASSVVSLWTSLYPTRHGNLYFPRRNSFARDRNTADPQVPPRIPLLAASFSELGYTTVGVVANPWLAPGGGFDRGFDRYDYLPDANLDHPYARGRHLNDIARTVIRDRGAEGAPFLIYLHYMDVHVPYEPASRDRRALGVPEGGRAPLHNGPLPNLDPALLSFASDLYDAEIHGFDRLMRDLYETLDDAGELRRTLLVVTSDHGDEFYEHGGLGHGWTLFDEVLHTPLVLHHPSLAPQRIAEPIHQVDVFPTLLDLLGGAPPADVDGRSHAAIVRDAKAGPTGPGPRVVFHELGDMQAVRRGAHKMIRARRFRPWEASFDTAADPREQRPLVPHPPWRAALQGALVAHLETPPVAAHQPAAPDAALRERLRALGYVEDAAPPEGEAPR